MASAATLANGKERTSEFRESINGNPSLSTTSSTTSPTMSTSTAQQAPSEAPLEAPSAQKPSNRKKFVLPLVAAVAIAGAVYGGRSYIESLHYEETDNAQVEANLYPIASRVMGQVQNVVVSDNQRVNAGDVLVALDPADYQVRRDLAAAALENAQAQIGSTRQSANVAESNAQAIQANASKITTDLQRSTNLRQQDVISQAEYDAVKANADALSAQFSAARGQIKTTNSQLPAQQANVKMREADLRNADLQLSYTNIKAPASGFVTKKNVQRGQFLQPGQSVMTVVGDEAMWVVANFKETQVGNIKEGQAVKLSVDAYPDVEFTGKVASIAAGTGSKFALLPPDNASGNFVKVTQRVPVKILVEPNAGYPLRAGMNVEVAVRVK
jgi:membrane fusion protein (multidrug efflux system)